MDRLTEEQALALGMARSFAAERLKPVAAALDRDASWPRAQLAGLAELGFMGMTVPEADGGAGFDPLTYALVIEALATGCASTAVIVSVNNSLVCEPIAKFGTDVQKRAWLPLLATGQRLGCFGLTEPSSGSDAAHMDTCAKRDGAGWRISGSKNWITNGPHADVMVLLAATQKQLGPKGVSAFLVPMDAPGVSRDRHDEKLGIHAAHSCTISFDEVSLGSDALLGAEGQGFKIAMATLDSGRIGIAAQAIGIAQAAFDAAFAYSQQRKAFGSLIKDKQAVQFMFADMATELRAARLLVAQAASAKERGGRYTREAAQAKLFASEMATRVTHRALQVFGGYGYSTEYPAERHYRDARITEIYEGTSEIMRLVVAGQMLKDAASLSAT